MTDENAKKPSAISQVFRNLLKDPDTHGLFATAAPLYKMSSNQEEDISPPVEIELIDPILKVEYLPPDATALLGPAEYDPETNTLTVWIAEYVYDPQVHFVQLTADVMNNKELTAARCLSTWKVNIDKIPTCSFFVPSQDQIESNDAEQVSNWKYNRGARIPQCTNEGIIAQQNGNRACTKYPAMVECRGFTPSAWTNIASAWVDDVAIAHLQRKFISCHIAQYQTVIGELVVQHATGADAESHFTTEIDALRNDETNVIITRAEKERVKYLEKVL
jgi:hypothetical protein